jgi:DtxR family Mn-dependent transcriptional regulator
MAERVRFNDLVRHLYEYQIEGHRCSVESIEGRLGLSSSGTKRLLAETEALGIVRRHAEAFVLTEWGQEFALREVRCHRAWVRYRARREDLARGRGEAWKARLSTSAPDEPSGSEGAPDQPGVSLFRVDVGESLEVVSIDARSSDLAAGLAKRGLVEGARITTVDRSDQTVRVRVGDEVASLGQVAAERVRVRRAFDEPTTLDPVVTLADLDPWEVGTVVQISPKCIGDQRRRLLDLGIVPGAEVVPEMAAGGGDPVAYRISDALVALRLTQAAQVEVRASSQAGVP